LEALAASNQDLLPLFDLSAQVWIADSPDLHQFHPSREQVFEFLQKTEVRFGVLLRNHVLELHAKIQVAVAGIEVVPQRGTEQRQALDPIAFA
jgi:hypothetical protein